MGDSRRLSGQKELPPPRKLRPIVAAAGGTLARSAKGTDTLVIAHSKKDAKAAGAREAFLAELLKTGILRQGLDDRLREQYRLV